LKPAMNIEITFSPMLADAPIPPLLLAALVRFLVATISLFLMIGVVGGVIFLIHFFLTLPMRRAERARLFLDLLESALHHGQSVEEMILSIAQSRDRTLGVRFHLLAAHVENGLRFVAALEKVPRFLPPQIAAMLRAGEKLGDLKKVLPAGREILQDRPAGVRSAVHYMILVVLFFSPVFVFVVMMTTTFVVPKFRDVAAGTNAPLWPLSQFVFDNTAWLIGFEIILFLLLMATTLLYIGGPQFARWLQFRE
jgi:type II secretory pathway component PulF